MCPFRIIYPVDFDESISGFIRSSQCIIWLQGQNWITTLTPNFNLIVYALWSVLSSYNCVFQRFRRRVIFRHPMFFLREKDGDSERWRVFVNEKRYRADSHFELFVPCKWLGILRIERLPREIPLTYLRWRHWRRWTYCLYFRFLADYVFFILRIILFYTFPFIFPRYFETPSVYESCHLRACRYRT